jgi:hypothetical protein
VLERAGLGSATKLAGQFYFTDFVVLKVMFTAVVTAMLGVYALSWLGIMDLRQLTVPPTWLMPNSPGPAVRRRLRDGRALSWPVLRGGGQPQPLHLPEAATVALVVGAALTAFRLLSLWERRHTPA